MCPAGEVKISVPSANCFSPQPQNVYTLVSADGRRQVPFRMASGTDLMDYNLYTDAGRGSVWGNSTGSWVSGTGAGMGTPQALTVYGRVAGGQTNLAAATYTEAAITVNITF